MLHAKYLYTDDRYNVTNSYKYFVKLAFEKRIKIIQHTAQNKKQAGN